MNERLRELESQCWEPRQYGPAWFNSEKFAELIVKECLLALEPDPMAPAIDYDVEQKFYQRSARKIKRHFGVEE